MQKNKTPWISINQYIDSFPEATKKKLVQMKKIIRKNAPQAEEKISYAIPTFFLNGNLVHFAGFDKHIGFYPGPTGISAFQKQIAKYTYAKGSVQFPLDQPLPTQLIEKIVQFRVKENMKKKSQLSKPQPAKK